MTSSNTLKKIISLGASLLLAVGGSLVATEAAHAVPVTNIKNMGYSVDWTPGTSATSTAAATMVNFSSGFIKDDVTALRGQTLTVSSTATSPAGSMVYAQIYFYASAQNATLFQNQLSSGYINPGSSSPVVVPQNAVAMRVSFNISWNSSVPFPASSTFTAMPSMSADGTVIPITSSTSGSGLYLVSSSGGWNSFNIYGVSQAFTTPSTGSNLNVNFDVTGCVDLSLVSSSTTYTASLKVNGVPFNNQNSPAMYELMEHSTMGMSQSPSVMGSTGSFASGTLATLLSNHARIDLFANGYQIAAASTQYDVSLELVDQNNHSLLKDCTPATPTGSGTLSFASNNLKFTPDSTTAALSSWGVHVYKVSDNSLVSTRFAYINGPVTLYGPIVNGVPTALPSGVAYYAKVFVRDSFGWGMTYLNSEDSTTSSPAFTIGGVTPPVVSTDTTDVTDITEDKRPLPVWASNIVKSIPTLTKSLNTSGGSVALTGGDYADLKSVTIGGKAVTFKIETNGNVSIPVPAGQAGKTADIVIVFAGGTMTVQDGIKYVAQTDVATVVERPIAIAAGAKKLTEAVADQIRQAAFANMTNTTVQCVAYASKNTVAAKAAAKLTAIQACGIAAAANPALKVSEVSVIVNKAKAKKQAVGIKVYK